MEQASSVAQRPQLEAALDYLRDGDVLVITKLDPSCPERGPSGRNRGTSRSQGCGAQVFFTQAIDTSTPTSPPMSSCARSIAQFERELMLERQREGIAKAKAEGKYKGRKPQEHGAKGSEVKRLRLEGIGPTAIAKRLNISRASVDRLAWI